MALGKGLNSLIPQQKKVWSIIRKETGIVNSGNDRVWQINILDVVPNPEQPRKEFNEEELHSLVLSIQKHGILQPLVMTERQDGGYELIAGERRLRAAGLAGLVTVPALVRTATQQEKLELALIENIQRHDLNPIEEAYAYARLLEEFNLTQEQAAEQLGKSRSTLANTIRLLDLPTVVQKALTKGDFSAGKARALLSLKTEKEQVDMFESMMGIKMSVREVENLVANKKNNNKTHKDPNMTAQEKKMEERLGAKVIISGNIKKGKIMISYSSTDELKRLISELS
ncbi:MAG: chromosome partitioning protein ParB [Candidatus Magasanikbacteria bacterium CG10_big_fil_rev_8_21_14_0_10_36_16]|uniref:Chromosome partitioning protein ParB n=1 Tax=Candidatus Magasanikbacteria bacterium CG10_big_fil_rev_8_21_14_0_10_36_16 TaxID=1974645 RepID=A0A2H0TXN0_9BACT|nr:MAG: chromosome partitioning protein ParB [Candidatus Magasanikbacteria bacterium CG10_big_fil_rev_8_21_14_0_10_36_16]